MHHFWLSGYLGQDLEYFYGWVELVLRGHSCSVLCCIFTGWDTCGIWFVGPLSLNLECTDGKHRNVCTRAIQRTCCLLHSRMKGHKWFLDRMTKQSGSEMSGKTKEGPQFWKSATGKTYWILNGHSAEVYSVAFLHDGTHIMSGLADETV